MLKSMTGFGKAECEWNSKKIITEIRSLNSKQFDLSLKIPSLYKEKESDIRNELSIQLERGKIDFVIRIDSADPEKNLLINKSAVIEHYRQIKEVSEQLSIKISDEQLFEQAMKMPDVLKSDQPSVNEEEWNIVLIKIKSAIEEVNNFRVREGKSLEDDIIKRINLIEKYLEEIKKFEENRISVIKNRINQNLEELVGKKNIDTNRFEQEIIYFLEKIDITEEKVRLKSHCCHFTETIQENTSNGRKLAFISQEIGREINTIGSKANDANIQKLVVQMKDELEKIKEQMLNVL